ncbi:MAG TPA: hypothetical protein VFX85_08355 [Solirubrobacterales bacterium]|nr:hypothetical protein [Solirubrobacterales bacterium]
MRSRPIRSLLAPLAVCLLGLGLTASPARAAEWSPGVALTDQLGKEDSLLPVVSVAPNGAAIATWRNAMDDSVRYAERPAGGSFSGRTALETGAPAFMSTRPAVAINAAGAAVAAWAAGSFSEEVVRASYRPAGGSFSPPVTISAAGKDATAPDVAITAGGKAIVVWSVGLGSLGERFVEASTHGTAGGFNTGQVLNDNDDTGSLLPVQPRLGLDGNGNAIAVFPTIRPGGPGNVAPVEWAPLSSGATAFGAPVDLEAGFVPDVALSPDGRATVVWQDEGTVYAAEQASAGGAFGSAKPVSDAGEANANTARVGVDGSGTATVTFQTGTPSSVVRYATRPAGGSFAAPVTLSSAGNSGSAELAVDAAGNAAAVWTRFNGSIETVEAAYRPAGAGFNAAKTLTKPGQPGILADVAIDAGGNATAVWQSTASFGVVWTSAYGEGGTTPPPGEGGGGNPGGGSGGGGSSGSGSSGSSGAGPGPTAAPAPAPRSAAKKPLKCGKGKKKKTVGGKPKCVKAKPQQKGKR